MGDNDVCNVCVLSAVAVEGFSIGSRDKAKSNVTSANILQFSREVPCLVCHELLSSFVAKQVRLVCVCFLHSTLVRPLSALISKRQSMSPTKESNNDSKQTNVMYL